MREQVDSAQLALEPWSFVQLSPAFLDSHPLASSGGTSAKTVTGTTIEAAITAIATATVRVLMQGRYTRLHLAGSHKIDSP